MIKRDGCTQCFLGADNPNAAVVGCKLDLSDAVKGGVYVLGPPVGVSGRPVDGMLGRVIRQELDGETYYCDAAIRCRPWDGLPKKNKKKGSLDVIQGSVKSCQIHTRQAIDALEPREIIAIGPYAARSLLGDDPGHAPLFGSHGWVRVKGKDVPVRILPRIESSYEELAHIRNALGRRRLVNWLESEIPPKSPPVRIVHMDTFPVFEEYIDRISREESVFFDTEVFGRAWNDSGVWGKHRRVFLISFSPVNLDAETSITSYVWDADSAEDNWGGTAFTKAKRLVARFMSNPSVEKVAWNAKFDAHAVYDAFGAYPNPLVDAMSLWKTLDVSEAASLAASGWRAGVGAHKQEAKSAVDSAVAEIRNVRRKLTAHKRAWIKKYGEEPSGPCLESTDLMGRVSDHLECRLDDLNIAVHDISKHDKAYAYAIADRGVMTEYNALDSAHGSRIYAIDRNRLSRGGKGLVGLWEHVAKPLPGALAKVERWGLPVDRGALELFSKHLDHKIMEVEGRIRSVASKYFSNFNPSSKPQVAELLYERLRIPVPKFNTKGKKTDTPSVAEQVLSKIKTKHPIIPDLMEYNVLTKMQSNYGCGMERWISSDGRVHPDFRVAHVASGRLSCTQPNVQTIPTKGEYAKMAKSVFAAIPGWTFISLDLSQIEVRVAAALSGDPVMCNLYRSGYDFHDNTSKMIAGPVFGMDDWEKANDDIKAKDPDRYQLLIDIRRMAKVVIFLLLYGGSDYNLSMKLGISVDQATDMRRAVLGGYSGLAEDIRREIKEAKSTGYARTMWAGEPARLRWIPDIQVPGWDNEKLRAHAENVAYNHKIQGSSSDLFLAALVRTINDIEKRKLPAEIVTTTHDQLLIHARNDVADEVGSMAKGHMETSYYMTRELEHGVPMVADEKRGQSWGALA